MSAPHPPSRRVIPADELITSTEAARILCADPRDPLFRRYDQLRTTGKLKPATLDPVRFDRLEVEYLARPYEPDLAPPDPLGAARGIGLAFGVSLLALGVVALGVLAALRWLR